MSIVEVVNPTGVSVQVKLVDCLEIPLLSDVQQQYSEQFRTVFNTEPREITDDEWESVCFDTSMEPGSVCKLVSLRQRLLQVAYLHMFINGSIDSLHTGKYALFMDDECIPTYHHTEEEAVEAGCFVATYPPVFYCVRVGDPVDLDVLEPRPASW